MNDFTLTVFLLQMVCINREDWAKRELQSDTGDGASSSREVVRPANSDAWNSAARLAYLK